MKKIMFLNTILLLLFISVKAQDEMAFDSKFAAGGGFTPVWIMPDLSALNDKLPGFGVDKLSTSGFFGTGGTGFISIPFIKNLRIGGIGFGGSSKSSANLNGFSKEVEYSASMGGFTAEYTLPFVKNIAVSLGAIIGGGSNTIEVYQNRTSYNWENLWQEVSNQTAQTQNIHRKMTNSHFIIAPTLNVDIPFYRFAAFRLGAGYKYALGNSWEYDNQQPLDNTPSNLNGNLLFLQAGIFIGFFNY
ncbi:MAG: hypothetical protein ACM34K_12530 [Bacillota bacterium]